MKIFDLIDNNVKVSPEILTIKAFKDIWDNDKSKNKDLAYKDFTYIYHMCDYNSPYSNYPVETRGESIKQEVIGDDKYKVNKLIEEGISQYKTLIETPLTRLLEASKKKIDDIVDLFNDSEPENMGEAEKAAKVMEKIGAISAGLKSLEEQVKKEKESFTSRIRGDKNVNSRYSD